MQNDRRIDIHNECQELLPWLVNGSLTEEQGLRLKAHVQSCAQCRSEYTEQLGVRDQMLCADTVVYAPHQSLQKLMARMEQPAALAPMQPKLAEARRPRMNRWLAAAILVEAIGIGLLASALLWKDAQQQIAPRFATLTSSIAPHVKGPAVRIVFVPAVTVDEINQLVRSVDAQIVAGPSEADVYTLAMTPDKDPATISAQVSRLRGDPRVRFAEPAVSNFRESR